MAGELGLLERAVVALERIAKAMEHRAADSATPDGPPFARLLAALAQARRPEQCASLWLRAKDALSTSEQLAGFGVVVAVINAVGDRTDGDAWLRVQVAEASRGAPKASATATAKAAP